jgi:hypothetical protein
MKKPRAVPETVEEVLLAIARRLKVSLPSDQGPLSDDQTISLIQRIGLHFIKQQPECKGFMTGRRGRGKNKRLAPTDNPDTLRKRQERAAIKKDAKHTALKARMRILRGGRQIVRLSHRTNTPKSLWAWMINFRGEDK